MTILSWMSRYDGQDGHNTAWRIISVNQLFLPGLRKFYHFTNASPFLVLLFYVSVIIY